MVIGEAALIAVVTALINGAVTWGVVSTKLQWLRADIDHAHRRLDALGAPFGVSSRRSHKSES